MNLFTGESADDYFGGEVPLTVRHLLRQALEARGDDRTTKLWSAQAMAPACLAVYYALYKHHAGRREFELAERAALRALSAAATQVGLPADHHAVEAEHVVEVDFQADGPARFWLFTLKALAFIKLRNGQAPAARELLARIQRLDPQARIGSDVTEALLRDGGAF